MLAADADTSGLGSEDLDAYLAWFPQEEYRTVHPGGTVYAVGASRGIVDHLKRVADVRGLRDFTGFDRFVTTFRNPTHVEATYYEAGAALWAAHRAATIDIELAPEIPDGERLRYPDFAWRTRFGDLLVECKQAARFNSDFNRRLDRCITAAPAVADGHVPERYRLDVRLRPVHLNGIERRVRKAAVRCF